MIDTIFVPRGAEENAVRKALARANSPLRVVPTGIGPRAAERAASEALAGPTIDNALVTGLCGLLSPAFGVGDALVYSELLQDGEDPVFLERELSAALAARIPSAQTGIRALAVTDIVTTAGAKKSLAMRYGVQAVDMESRAVALRLHEAGVCVCVVRIASDGASDDLPDLHMALDGSGGLDTFALALALARRPVAGARLARNGTRALAALERAMRAIAGA